ncbi:MAG: hypothetical protein E4G91_11980, partial [Candidatus Zixiibacteriota bacterium]
MPAPRSFTYKFESLLSQNDLCQSWLAVNLKSEKKCFLKTPNSESVMPQDSALSIMNRSFDCQTKIKHPAIVTATGNCTEQGRFFAEYPYLDSSRWQTLTPELFWEYFDDVIVQMSSLVDFLHLYDLVHCDLKLSNFLIDISAALPQLCLVDFDFLCPSGTSPDARVFGSPDHIAPEILSNDKVLPQTDNYSLGIAINKCVEALRESGSDPDELRSERVGKLAGLLTNEDPVHRPSVLLEALHGQEIIDSSRLAIANKVLLSRMLLERFKSIGRGVRLDARTLNKFIMENARVLGFSEEFLNDIAVAYDREKLKTFRIVRRLIECASVERYWDWWRLSISDDDVTEAWDHLDDILELASGDGESIHKTVDTAILYAHDLEEVGRPFRAYLTLKRALIAIQSSDSTESTVLTSVLTDLARLSLSLNRLRDSEKYYQLLADHSAKDSLTYLKRLHEQVHVVGDLGHTDERSRMIDDGLAVAKSLGDEYHELVFLRIRAFDDGFRGNYERAEETLNDVLTRCAGHNYYEPEVKAHYTRGIICWRRGQYLEAERHILEAYERAEKYGILSQCLGVVSTLSSLGFESAEYHKALRYGKLALKLSSHASGSFKPGFTIPNLIHAYCRLGVYKKAEYWLVRML